MGRPPEGSQDLKPWLNKRLLPVMVPGESESTDGIDARIAQDAEPEDRKFLEQLVGKELDDGTQGTPSDDRGSTA